MIRKIVRNSGHRFLCISLIILLTSIAAISAYTLPDATAKTLVFSDQLNEAPGTANFTFNATHYVGMQKIDRARILAYRQISPEFIVLQYHKAYGTDLGGNLTSANPPYWNNDCDTFYAWVARHPAYGARENYYIHFDNILDSAHRVQHFFAGTMECWLADIRHEGWKNYVAEETSRRCRDIGFDGAFFDVGYFPSYDYVPSNWCETAPFNAPAFTQFADTWNNSFAIPYWAFIRNYYHSSGRNQLCIVNCDQMITGWYEEKYLDSTDGGMTEGFFTYGNRLTGADWRLSATRILRYITGAGKDKVLLAQCSPGATDFLQRRWCIGNYLLLKNRYSYYNIAYGSASNWWPEYEIDLGAFTSQPAGLNDLLISGTTSLYKRDFLNGMVLVNPGTAPETYALIGSFQSASFSGGGNVNNGALPIMALTWGNPVTGNVTVNAGEVMILRKEGGPSVEKRLPRTAEEAPDLLVKIYSITGKLSAITTLGEYRVCAQQKTLARKYRLVSGIYLIKIGSGKSRVRRMVVID